MEAWALTPVLTQLSSPHFEKVTSRLTAANLHAVRTNLFRFNDGGGGSGGGFDSLCGRRAAAFGFIYSGFAVSMIDEGPGSGEVDVRDVTFQLLI